MLTTCTRTSNWAPTADRYYRVFVYDENGRDVGVAAISGLGDTKDSEVPGAVKNLAAEGGNASQIDLSWDEPDDTVAGTSTSIRSSAPILKRMAPLTLGTTWLARSDR